MRAAAREGFATATDLADYLVRRGLPFRDAHEAVARAVRHAEGKACDLADLPLAELRAFSPLIEDDVFAVLTLEGSVGSRNHPGGTAPAQVRAAIAAARKALAAQMNSVDAAGHDWLGYLAGALTTIAFVPQVLRIVRTRSARDISWGMFFILSAGVALWLWYGIRVGSLPLIAANAVTLALVLTILVPEVALRRRRSAASARERDDRN